MSRWHDQTVDEERSFPGVSSSSGEAVKESCSAPKPKGGAKFRCLGKERSLTKVWSGQAFCSDWSLGTNSLANHL